VLGRSHGAISRSSCERSLKASSSSVEEAPLVRSLGWEGMDVVARKCYARTSHPLSDHISARMKGHAGVLVADEATVGESDLTGKRPDHMVRSCAVVGVQRSARAAARRAARLTGPVLAKVVQHGTPTADHPWRRHRLNGPRACSPQRESQPSTAKRHVLLARH
jgi:hypothetical protein